VLVADEFNNRVEIFMPSAPTSAPPAPTPPERPVSAPGPTPVRTVTAARATALRLTVSTHGGVRALLRAGLRLRLTCSRACLATVHLQLAAADARRLGLSRSRRPLTISARSLRASRARPRLITMTPQRAAAALQRASAPHMRLLVTGVDAAGNRARIDHRLKP
jgi:hypothetical protein